MFPVLWGFFFKVKILHFLLGIPRSLELLLPERVKPWQEALPPAPESPISREGRGHHSSYFL